MEPACGLFLGDMLEGQAVIHKRPEGILWAESPAAIRTWADSSSPLARRAETHGRETSLPFQLIVCGLLLNLLTVPVI